MAFRSFVVAASLVTLTGCAAQQGVVDNRPARYASLSRDCVFMDTVDDWSVVDPYHIVLYAPYPSSPYLVELASYCQPLAMHPEFVRIDSHEFGLLCGEDQDSLLVGGQSCAITNIQPITPGQEPKPAG